jgi:uncharacterized protein YndB with AHSA1/START domain
MRQGPLRQYDPKVGVSISTLAYEYPAGYSVPEHAHGSDQLIYATRVGAEGFTAPVCKMDFRVGGKFLCCMRTPDGQEFWNAVEYHEIVPHEKIVSLMYFSDSKGNKIEPAQLGIEHEAIDGAYDVTIFEDLGNGQTKLTFIGNEPMESAKNSGQMEGWNQILDKVAAVIAGLMQAK